MIMINYLSRTRYFNTSLPSMVNTFCRSKMVSYTEINGLFTAMTIKLKLLIYKVIWYVYNFNLLQNQLKTKNTKSVMRQKTY